MPETATLAEISERLATLAGLRCGQRDIDTGRVVTQDHGAGSLVDPGTTITLRTL